MEQLWAWETAADGNAGVSMLWSSGSSEALATAEARNLHYAGEEAVQTLS